MPEIKIYYDIPTRAFIASDEQENKVSFQTSPDGVKRDSSPSISTSIRPMQGMLMSLGSCSGIDIVSILEKQRQEFTSFNILINAEREKNVTPSLWKKVHIEFILKGNLDEDKVKRAAALSIDKYCSVAETMRRSGCEIIYTTEI